MLFFLGTPLRLCIILTVRSRQECHQRSLNLKATDSGKSGHTQYVFVYANSAGCPEEHFDGDTLSHGRDDDEGIHMCTYVCVFNVCDLLLQKVMLELSPNSLAPHVCVSNAFFSWNTITIMYHSYSAFPSRVPSKVFESEGHRLW